MIDEVKTATNGLIIKSNAGLYDVYVMASGEIVQTKSRGVLRHEDKQPLVGDHVQLERWEETPVIVEIAPRKNELIRPRIANIDVCLTFISVKEPTFQQYLLDKYIALLEANEITPIVVLTKYDLLRAAEKLALEPVVNYYRNIGYAVFIVADKQLNDATKLHALLAHKIATVMGQTGVGKTTVLNDLSGNMWDLKTAAISQALGRGKHTTRIVELFRLNNYWLADTPGFSSFHLSHIAAKDLTKMFIEFADYPCQFSDCVHMNERKCGVKAALEAGEILPERYESYRKLYKEVKTQEDEKKW
jgi:ribosome biogenesis GTPase